MAASTGMAGEEFDKESGDFEEAVDERASND